MMRISLLLLFAALLSGKATFAQHKSLQDSLRCTQFLDTTSGRMLYLFPEKDVRFRGGTEGLTQDIVRKLYFDRRVVPGQMILNFNLIVEPDGTISNVRLRKATPGTPQTIIDSAIKTLGTLKKVKPAECNGTKVPVLKSLPIVLVVE